MRFHVTTLGCPKNVVDSEMMAELLRQAGHAVVETPADADVLIVNTCGFIAAARDESCTTLRELAAAKSPQQLLVAAGCMAQRYGAALRRREPALDAVIGTRSWPQIVSFVERLAAGPRRQLHLLVEEQAMSAYYAALEADEEQMREYVAEFAANPDRARDFAEDIRHRGTLSGGRRVWPLIHASLRSALGARLGPASPNADLNARIGLSILGCFPPGLIEGAGCLGSFWLDRLARTADQAEGLLGILTGNPPGDA